MRVLLVDGFAEPADVVDVASEILAGSGHEVTLLRLAEAGFDQTMSAAERAAYHDDDNLVTPEQRESAALLRSNDAVLVCTPIRAGAIEARVKSWFERVFVPGVSFTFTPSGRVTAALTNVVRVGMIVVCPDHDPTPHGRNGSTRSVLRGVRLNAARRCRTTYATIGPGHDAEAVVRQALARW